MANRQINPANVLSNELADPQCRGSTQPHPGVVPQRMENQIAQACKIPILEGSCMIVTIRNANSVPLKHVMTGFRIPPLVASRKAMGKKELRSQCIVLAVAAISVWNDQCQVCGALRFYNTSIWRYVNAMLGAEEMEYSGQIIQLECQAHTV